MVQSDLRFLYFAVISLGSTNDNVWFELAKGLKAILDQLPQGLYTVANAAYTLSETVLIPFTGAHQIDAANHAFNFYLSQLRIRVEMAFGRLVKKRI